MKVKELDLVGTLNQLSKHFDSKELQYAADNLKDGEWYAAIEYVENFCECRPKENKTDAEIRWFECLMEVLNDLAELEEVGWKVVDELQ